jgi:hypothetical protein
MTLAFLAIIAVGTLPLAPAATFSRKRRRTS